MGKKKDIKPEAPERDYDAELKDKEMEEEIPATNADKLWRHLSPKKVMTADTELLLRVSVLFMALKGHGVSQHLWEQLPKNVQAIFNDELLDNESWHPADHF